MWLGKGDAQSNPVSSGEVKGTSPYYSSCIALLIGSLQSLNIRKQESTMGPVGQEPTHEVRDVLSILCAKRTYTSCQTAAAAQPAARGRTTRVTERNVCVTNVLKLRLSHVLLDVGYTETSPV
jgi:hypothetical protein